MEGWRYVGRGQAEWRAGWQMHGAMAARHGQRNGSKRLASKWRRSLVVVRWSVRLFCSTGHYRPGLATPTAAKLLPSTNWTESIKPSTPSIYSRRWPFRKAVAQPQCSQDLPFPTGRFWLCIVQAADGPWMSPAGLRYLDLVILPAIVLLCILSCTSCCR